MGTHYLKLSKQEVKISLLHLTTLIDPHFFSRWAHSLFNQIFQPNSNHWSKKCPKDPKEIIKSEWAGMIPMKSINQKEPEWFQRDHGLRKSPNDSTEIIEPERAGMMQKKSLTEKELFWTRKKMWHHPRKVIERISCQVLINSVKFDCKSISHFRSLRSILNRQTKDRQKKTETSYFYYKRPTFVHKCTVHIALPCVYNSGFKKNTDNIET